MDSRPLPVAPLHLGSPWRSAAERFGASSLGFDMARCRCDPSRTGHCAHRLGLARGTHRTQARASVGRRSRIDDLVSPFHGQSLLIRPRFVSALALTRAWTAPRRGSRDGGDRRVPGWLFRVASSRVAEGLLLSGWGRADNRPPNALALPLVLLDEFFDRLQRMRRRIFPRLKLGAQTLENPERFLALLQRERFRALLQVIPRHTAPLSFADQPPLKTRSRRASPQSRTQLLQKSHARSPPRCGLS